MTGLQYTWDPKSCRPYESIWSLLQKFALLNACGPRDIQRAFGAVSKRGHPQNWSDRDRNLHGWGALDSTVVQTALDATAEQIARASTYTFLRPEEVKVLAAQSLRFCPSCIRDGFHSPFHQLLFMEQCPVHRCRLRMQCEKCGTTTGPYSLTRQSFHIAYGCGTCGQRWWHGPHGAQACAVPNHPQSELFHEVGEWLVKRKDNSTIEAGLIKLARFMEGDQEFEASVRQLPQRWADILGVPLPRGGFARSRHCEVHVMMRTVSDLSQQEASSENDIKRFAIIYRSIRRHLIRQFHKQHRRCFERLGKGIWFPVSDREVHVKRFCKAGYALLLWRMFWEDITVPQNFFGRQLQLIYPQIQCEPEWIPRSLPIHVRERLFGMDCLRTYRRCGELSEQVQQKGRITFPLWRLAKRRAGEWIVQHPTETTTYLIHWWWPTRWQPRIDVEPHVMSKAC